jgi:hypothetical protein
LNGLGSRDGTAGSTSRYHRNRNERKGKPIHVSLEGRTMTFDSFECAIHAMAPSCAHCGYKIVGHGPIVARIAPNTRGV